jgi:hypothetical protein
VRRLSYFQRASRQFLNGTRHRTPAEAVEAGSRTLEQWVNLLSEERELEGAHVLERKTRQQQRHIGIDQAQVDAVQAITLQHSSRVSPAQL